MFGTGTVMLPWAVIEILSRDYKMAVGLIIIWLSGQLVRGLVAAFHFALIFLHDGDILRPDPPELIKSCCQDLEALSGSVKGCIPV